MLTNKEIIDNAPDGATHYTEGEVFNLYYKNITSVGFEYYCHVNERWLAARGKPLPNAAKIPLEPAEDCYQDFAATLAKLFVRKERSDLKSETPKKKRTLIEKRNATIQGQRAHIKSLQNKIDELTKPKTERRFVVYDKNGVFVAEYDGIKGFITEVGDQIIKIEVNV